MKITMHTQDGGARKVSLYILDKRLRLTGTAAPANRPLAALVPEEWEQEIKSHCRSKGMAVAAYLRNLLQADAPNRGGDRA